MKVIIAGGGTGGHLYPGIAIAREVLKDRTNDVLFIGTKQGIEAKVLPREGLPLRFITVGKLKGMKLGAIVKTMIMLPLSVMQSIRLLRDEKPDVVIGIGGYSSGPVAFAAWVVRVPLLIVEPNSYAGLANRNLGRLARKIILCFPGTGAQPFFPAKKTIKVGPLVRKGIDEGIREKAIKDFGLKPGDFTLFVLGGSGGAHALNMIMEEVANILTQIEHFQILHQTGEKDVADVSARYRDAGIKAVVLPYIHDMAGAYAIADLVVSRSGATTVAELAVCGKRAVLIPFPFAADDHQTYNARMLAERGTAVVIAQQDLKPETLAEHIFKYARQDAHAHIPRMENTAAEEIARMCKDYVQTN
jgi:UDP-N-acetylglucosamine--N-acetylmuramyl-(pentapeptide) pyrophosphoryl-undecaprenol N-acetylglucosamine transferase